MQAVNILSKEELIKQDIIGNVDQKLFDPIGYDLRLEKISFITRGETRILEKGVSIEIFPEETINAETIEFLKLPDNVFAIGSPKMRRLLKGLWAHGGKTDPGYHGNLTISFKNVGNEKIILTYGDTIFHLTFFCVEKQLSSYSKTKAIDGPSEIKSKLEGECIDVCDEDFLIQVKDVDGIKSHRLCSVIGDSIKNIESNCSTKMDCHNGYYKGNKIFMVCLSVYLFILTILVLPKVDVLPLWQWVIGVGTLITAILTIINLFLDVFGKIYSFFKKDNGK